MDRETITQGSDAALHRKHTAEIDLIERARVGDDAAIAELYSRHVDAIYRYVYARTRERTVAEDLTAQVFLTAIEDLPRYQPGDVPFAAWLYRIACARVADHWRNHYRHEEVSLTASLAADTDDPCAEIEAEQRWVTAIDLLSELTEDQQAVLFLRFIGEMELAEVAAALGKTIGAVKAIQHRAMASLARLLAERNC